MAKRINRLRQIAVMLLLIFGGRLCSSEISVQISGGVERIEAFDESNVSYFSMSQLAGVLGEKVSWGIVGMSAEYSSEGHHATFYINSPYINIDDTVKNLTYSAKVSDGALFLPAITFLPLFDMIRPEKIAWDEGRKTIRVNSEWYNITDIAFSAKANGFLIEIFVAEPTNYEIYTSEGDWLNVSIPNGTVNIRQVLSRKNNKLVKDLNAYQFEGTAQISIRLRQKLGKFTHRFQPNPGRIQISLPDTSFVPVTATVEKFGPGDKIEKFIIDPGHGGKDYGAIGVDKSREKEIVLDIGKRLAKLARQDKIFRVVMTREKDIEVPLQQRAKIANDGEGDVYVSIHANASPKRNARGFQVFFLAPAKNDMARAAAQLENAPFLAETGGSSDDNEGDLDFILSDMIQTEFQVESADLAAMVDKEFRKNFSDDTKARGIDQAGFVVLNKVYMPSILVETAFLTNRQDEKLLKSKKYRQDVAEAIYAGLKRFKAKYEKE